MKKIDSIFTTLQNMCQEELEEHLDTTLPAGSSRFTQLRVKTDVIGETQWRWRSSAAVQTWPFPWLCKWNDRCTQQWTKCFFSCESGLFSPWSRWVHLSFWKHQINMYLQQQFPNCGAPGNPPHMLHLQHSAPRGVWQWHHHQILPGSEAQNSSKNSSRRDREG